MNLPAIEGVIRRRILVNFRVEPEVLRPYVPARFQLETVNGYAMAGICLIRLERVRPKPITARVGLASDNVAYRVAVRWESDGKPCGGVFIPRRDTSSTLQRRLGGRIFPGEYHRAVFETTDEEGSIAIGCRSADGRGDVRLVARETDRFPSRSVFGSLEEASAFFRRGSVGYSATSNPAHLDGLLLRTNCWSVSPLDVELVESSYFDDPSRFPVGSVELDNALIMRNVAHEWHTLPRVDMAA